MDPKMAVAIPRSVHLIIWPRDFRFTLDAGYTKAVDVWSWALVTYEMLRGRPAFGTAQDTAYQVYLRVMKAKYKMPQRHFLLVQNL